MNLRKLLSFLLCLVTITLAMDRESELKLNLVNETTAEDKMDEENLKYQLFENEVKCTICNAEDKEELFDIHKSENCNSYCCKNCANEKYVKNNGLYCLKCGILVDRGTLNKIIKELKENVGDEENECEICRNVKDLINVHDTEPCKFRFCKDCAHSIHFKDMKRTCSYCNRQLNNQEMNILFQKIKTNFQPNNALNVVNPSNNALRIVNWVNTVNVVNRNNDNELGIQFVDEQDNLNLNGQNNCQMLDNLCEKMNFMLSIPNWIIPLFFTMDKAFLMTISQFLVRLPRDFDRPDGQGGICVPIANVLVSSGILVANYIFLWNAYESGEGGEHMMNNQTEIGCKIIVPIAIILDFKRWQRWNDETIHGQGHFLPIVTGVSYKNVIRAGIIGTTLFMPIVLQQPYFQILLISWVFQMLRALEWESNILLFVANIIARCLVYDDNPFTAFRIVFYLILSCHFCLMGCQMNERQRNN